MTETQAANTDQQVRLTTVPFTINVEAIALGILDMFTDSERVALRFGLLPAEKMHVLQRALREKFENATCQLNPGLNDDKWFALTRNDGAIDFSMKRLVSEAMHLVTLELYKHGELVV